MQHSDATQRAILTHSRPYTEKREGGGGRIPAYMRICFYHFSIATTFIPFQYNDPDVGVRER